MQISKKKYIPEYYGITPEQKKKANQCHRRIERDIFRTQVKVTKNRKHNNTM